MGIARTNNPGSKPGPRFDFESFERLMLGSDHLYRESSGNYTNLRINQVSRTYIAKVCNVQPSIVGRWAKEGLTFYAADKAAISIGYHPEVIWPDWSARGAAFYDR